MQFPHSFCWVTHSVFMMETFIPAWESKQFLQDYEVRSLSSRSHWRTEVNMPVTQQLLGAGEHSRAQKAAAMLGACRRCARTGSELPWMCGCLSEASEYVWVCRKGPRGSSRAQRCGYTSALYFLCLLVVLQAEAVQLVALRPFDGICKRSTTLSSASRGKQLCNSPSKTAVQQKTGRLHLR